MNNLEFKVFLYFFHFNFFREEKNIQFLLYFNYIEKIYIC